MYKDTKIKDSINEESKTEKEIKMNLKGRKAGLVMVLFFFLFFGGSSDSPESTAKFAAEKLVKDKLKAPSTANFIGAEIIDKKDDPYLVKVTADAQNSFGAMIRGNFLVVVKVNVSGALHLKSHLHLKS